MKKILKRLFSKKQKRELPVLHVYTFKSGEQLFTYRQEDFGKVSSRYYRNIMEATNYLQTFLLTKNEWESAVNGCKNIITNSLDSTNMKDRTQALIDINSTFDWFISKAQGLKNTNEIILEIMFCMFYILEEEKETGYSEIYNKKKVDLLNSEPDTRDFFFQNLKKNITSFIPISSEDSIQLLLNLEQMKGALTSLNFQKDWTP